jgi:hypothetical protein
LDNVQQIVAQKLDESALKQQCDILRNEKKELAKEIADLREKFMQLKAERDALLRAEEQWKIERAVLAKKIEMVSQSSL